METLATICEIVMVLCFGASWPFNVIRAYKARTTKGTSLPFMSLIGIGYVGGILCKIFTMCNNVANGKAPLTWLGWVAFAFYLINITLVSTGIAIYFRNKKLDEQAAKNK